MSMRVPDEFIALLRERVDIVDIISEHVRLKKTGRSYVGLCPFHSERTPSFNVTPAKGMYYCFGCGAGGTAITFLMEVEQITFGQAIEKLAARASLPLPVAWSDSLPDGERERRQRLLQFVGLAAKFYNHILMNHDAGAQALDYISGRGLAKKTMAEFTLGYAPRAGRALCDFLLRRGASADVLVDAGLAVVTDEGALFDRFRDRVMFPIADGQGRAIGFGARAMGETQPKYLNSSENPVFRKGQVLYGYDKARQAIRQTGQVLLLEGYMDVIALHQSGIRHAVAGLGTSLTADQAHLLRRVAEDVVLVYDGDAAGQKAAVRSLQVLREAGLQPRVAELPQGVDPDEWVRAHGASAFRTDVLGQAKRGLEFELRQLTARHPDHLTTGRMDYLKDAVRVVASEASALERESAVNWLSRSYEVSVEALREDLRTQMRLVEQERRTDKSSLARDTVSRARGREAFPAVPALLRQDREAAERLLLTYMLLDADVARLVASNWPEEFSIPVHSALQAYLYQFYEDHDTADPVVFLSGMDDPTLVQFAAGLLQSAEETDDRAMLEAIVRDCVECLRLRAAESEMDRLTGRMKEAHEQGDTETLRTLQDQLMELQTARARIGTGGTIPLR